MHASALPLARCQPVLEPEQPEVCPGHDRLDQREGWAPFPRSREEEAEPNGRFGVDVGQLRSPCEFDEVGSDYDDLRRLLERVGQAELIASPEWRGPRCEFP